MIVQKKNKLFFEKDLEIKNSLVLQQSKMPLSVIFYNAGESYQPLHQNAKSPRYLHVPLKHELTPLGL